MPGGQPFDAELLGDAVRAAVSDAGRLAALVDGVLVGARADAPGRPEPRPNRTYNEITRRMAGNQQDRPAPPVDARWLAADRVHHGVLDGNSARARDGGTARICPANFRSAHAGRVELASSVLRVVRRSARDLPWRAAGASPWAVLVSEIMLQQTPVARVEPVYRTWLTRWPTPADLGRAGPGDAVRMWGKLGYPRRALRLWECAVVLDPAIRR